MSKTPVRLLLFSSLLFFCLAGLGQEESQWNGVWNAEGTLFRIAILVEDGELKVTQIESLGFEWTNEDGKIEGNIATVVVDYGGAKGTIRAELIDENTAVASATSCVPDFMVVCLLSKDRQAIFRKVASN